MTIQAMKAAKFKKMDGADWKESAVKTLRGAPFDSLITETIEGIELQPLYTAQQFRRSEAEMQKTVSVIRGAKDEPGWTIAQPAYAKTAEAFLKELKDSLARGNEAIVYDGRRALEWDVESLAGIVELLPAHPVFFSNIKSDDRILEVFDLLSPNERESVKGTVTLLNGAMPEGFTNVRTVGADATGVHEAGADILTELALVVAEAAESAIAYESFEAFSEQFFVRFAVDTQYFMEIAKLRAFRILWDALGTAFEAKSKTSVPVLCETSLRTYSKLDPYVNLLRAGNETFAAVLGGADVITVHPHDVLTGTSPASNRFARNVQLVIKEETLVNKVHDPAAGSYFLETLTKELVEKAWQLFLQIEQSGGYTAYVKSGMLARRLQALHAERMADVATSNRSLIGTNVYADLGAAPLDGNGEIEIDGRLAEPFEQLRAYFQENELRATLLTFGNLKDFKRHADFVSGFLATGGIDASRSPELNDVEEAVQWLHAEKPDYAVVCATPEVTESIMDKLLEACPGEVILDVAGNYDRTITERWSALGLNGFIQNGQNKIEKLNDLKKLVTRG